MRSKQPIRLCVSPSKRTFFSPLDEVSAQKGTCTMARHYLFTSESVTEGHPDKVCDQISDAVLDAILEQDPNGRVACETTACTGLIHVMGEITTSCYVDIAHIAREVVRDIGYDRGKYGFDCDTCAVVTSIDEQSADIAMGVDKSLENKEGTDSELSNGAGDQGMMFGYACDETPELMPLPLSLAQKLCKRMAEVRKSGQVPYMRPDGKSQVTVEYDEHNRPVRVDTVVISTQHDPDVSLEQIRKDMIEQVAKAVIPADMLDENTKYYVNPTGRFVKGGPAADSGVTGRKSISDTYGGCARHGGGSFSGKDASKVDRSGAYLARYIAKNIVAADLADRCEVQLAYAIGLAEPVSFRLDTFGTERLKKDDIYNAVLRAVDMRPMAIMEKFGLMNPIFSRVSCYGHFGSNAADMPWERTDLQLSV